MNINFDVVIKSDDHQVDMDYGLKTLAGTSRVVSTMAEAILKKRFRKEERVLMILGHS